MTAVVVIQHNPDIRQLYERLLHRSKAKMAAFGAAMRKLVQSPFASRKISKNIALKGLDRGDGIYPSFPIGTAVFRVGIPLSEG